jgi:hypothetical protein
MPPLCIPAGLSGGGVAARAVLRPQGARSGGASVLRAERATRPGALPRTPGYFGKEEEASAASLLTKYPGGSGAAAGGRAPLCDLLPRVDLPPRVPGSGGG